MGHQLSAVLGRWTPGTTFTYQWRANGAAISGARSSRYVLRSAQAGRRITVLVTGKVPGHGRIPRPSAQSARVVVAGTPAVTGVSVAGGRLAGRTGKWAKGTRIGYQWLANNAPITRATRPTLTPGTWAVGKRISLRVTGRRTGYATVTVRSRQTLLVARATTPRISGGALVTHTLTAVRGPWTPRATFSYRWLAAGRPIAGATQATLAVGSALKGKRISVRVTGRRAGFPTITRTSAQTGKVGYPGRTRPVDGWRCPSWAPIKGNAESGIYHVPGQRYYERTNPEECFRTERNARNAGYRKAKV